MTDFLAYASKDVDMDMDSRLFQKETKKSWTISFATSLSFTIENETRHKRA